VANYIANCRSSWRGSGFATERRINEISGRYSVMKDEFYLPPETQIKRQSRDNKQGATR
jgi:thymidylate synthase ThyX